MKIEIGTEKGCESCKELDKKLSEYNHSFAGPYNETALNLFIRDDEGELLGGLIGITYWGWLYVDTLIIDETLRGSGLGSKLLEQAETEAEKRGCRGVHLDTHDFQALEFYKSHGYRVNSEIKNLPENHSKYQLIKDL